MTQGAQGLSSPGLLALLQLGFREGVRATHPLPSPFPSAAPTQPQPTPLPGQWGGIADHLCLLMGGAEMFPWALTLKPSAARHRRPGA